MIDWLNPSEDVVEAKRIGFDEGLECAKEQIEGLKSELEAAKADTKELKETNNFIAEEHNAQAIRAEEFAETMGENARLRIELKVARNRIEELEEQLADTCCNKIDRE